jgi:hypothetical protein
MFKFYCPARSNVMSRIPLANTRGSEALILSRAREEAVVKSKARRDTKGAARRMGHLPLEYGPLLTGPTGLFSKRQNLRMNHTHLSTITDKQDGT